MVAADQDYPNKAAVTSQDDTSHRERSCMRAIRYAMVHQFMILFVSLLIRDGGRTFHCAFNATLLSWAPIVLVVCHQATRRDYIPSNVHLAIVKYSFWVFFIGLCVISAIN
jgi:hypothetical protein